MRSEKEPALHDAPAEGHSTSAATAVLEQATTTISTLHEQAAKPVVAPPKYDDEDFVCFVRLNWGTPNIPPDKVDYVDKYTFVGGVCRNVRYGDAKVWVKRRTVHGFIVENDATMQAISQVTGRNPESPENIAAAIHTMSPEKILAILGPEQAKILARAILGVQ